MSFWSLPMSQAYVATLYDSVAMPIQCMLTAPATVALGAVGLTLPSSQTNSKETSHVAESSAAHTEAPNTFDGLTTAMSYVGERVESLYSSVATPAAAYVPAPIAAFATYNPLTFLGPKLVIQTQTNINSACTTPSSSSTVAASPPVVPETSTLSGPALAILMALAANPQVQGMITAAVVSIASSALPAYLRAAPTAAPNAVAAATPYLPFTPSPMLNNRLNFGGNTNNNVSAALMNIVAARYAREFEANKPATGIRATPATNSPSVGPYTTVGSAFRGFPFAVIGLVGAVAVPILMEAVTSTVRVARNARLATTNTLVTTSEPSVVTVVDAVKCPVTNSVSTSLPTTMQVPAETESAELPAPGALKTLTHEEITATSHISTAIASPMRQELQRIALFAGRNVALAVLYYVLVKYCGPAGISLRVAFALATVLLDVLI